MPDTCALGSVYVASARQTPLSSSRLRAGSGSLQAAQYWSISRSTAGVALIGVRQSGGGFAASPLSGARFRSHDTRRSRRASWDEPLSNLAALHFAFDDLLAHGAPQVPRHPEDVDERDRDQSG